MKELINENLIVLDYEPSNQRDILNELSELMLIEGRLNNKDDFIDAVIARENEFPTCFDFGVAIPHGKTDACKVPSLAFMRLKNPMDWSENCKNQAKIVFLIGVLESEAGNTHLKILAKLSRLLMDDGFRKSMIESSNKYDVMKVLEEKLLSEV